MEFAPAAEEQHEYWKRNSMQIRNSAQPGERLSRSENNSPKGKHSSSSSSKKFAPRKSGVEGAARQKIAFVRKGSPPERNLADKSNFQSRIKENVEVAAPKITILQRPHSKEAAMLDLAKITGMPLAVVYEKNGLRLAEEQKQQEQQKQQQQQEQKKQQQHEQQKQQQQQEQQKQQQQEQQKQQQEEQQKQQQHEQQKQQQQEQQLQERKAQKQEQQKKVKQEEQTFRTKSKLQQRKMDLDHVPLEPVQKHSENRKRSSDVAASRKKQFVKVEKLTAGVVEVAKHRIEDEVVEVTTMVAVEETKRIATPKPVASKVVELISSMVAKKAKGRTTEEVEQAASAAISGVTEMFSTPPPSLQSKGKKGRNFSDYFLPLPLLDERWAGPAFTNSPPPSCLPIPSFATCRSESMVDTELATQGLRRILNLDV